MNPQPPSPLLAATLGNDQALEALTARQVRDLARQRRRGRAARRGRAVALVILALGLFLLPRSERPATPAAFTLVRTQPLAPTMLVQRDPALSDDFRLVMTRAGAFDLLSTDPLRLHLDHLDDAGLRAVLAAHRAGLIIPAGEPARVIFH